MTRRIYTYNLLNAGQFLLGFIFNLALAKQFGAGAETDVYFLSSVMILFLSNLGLVFTEMFLQHYSDLYVANVKEAESFYRAVFCLSILVGLCSYLLGVVLLNQLVLIFAPGFDGGRVELLRQFFAIQGLSLVCFRAMNLNNELINAHMKFSLPYVVGMMVHIMNIGFLFLLAKYFGIKVLAISAVVSGLLAIFVQNIYIRSKLGVRLGLKLSHPNLRRLFKGSFPLRMGHQLWGLREVITTSILSGFPVGAISIYSYAWKISSILFTVTNSPILQIFQSKASRTVSDGNYVDVPALRKDVMRKNLLIYSMVLIPSILLMPALLRFFLSRSISPDDIRAIYMMFLAVVPIHVIMSFEMPFVYVTVALKRSEWIFRIAVVSIVLYAATVYLAKSIIGIYAIPAALCITHAVNVLIRASVEKRCIKEHGLNAQLLGGQKV